MGFFFSFAEQPHRLDFCHFPITIDISWESRPVLHHLIADIRVAGPVINWSTANSLLLVREEGKEEIGSHRERGLLKGPSGFLSWDFSKCQNENESVQIKQSFQTVRVCFWSKERKRRGRIGSHCESQDHQEPGCSKVKSYQM